MNGQTRRTGQRRIGDQNGDFPGRQFDAIDPIGFLIGTIQQALSVEGHVGQECARLGGGAGHGDRRNGFPAAHVECAQGIEIGDVEGLVDERHALGRMQRDVGSASLDELEAENFAVRVQLGDKAVVVGDIRFAVDAGNKIFLARLAADEAIGSLKLRHGDLREGR